MAGLGSEDELISIMRKLLSEEAPGVTLGPGDDAALVDFGPHLGVLTTDMMVEGVHFQRQTITPRDLGYKALARAVSDVAAMGGSPRYGLVSLALPPDVEVPWVVELYGGLRDGAAEYAMSVVGGDTSRAAQVVLSIAVAGEVAVNGAVTRAGARPGDRIVITGTIGAAAGGLALSQASPHEAGSAAASRWGRELLAAQSRPIARVGEGQTLAQSGATAMIDVSDGLALDLSRLCRESGVGAAIKLGDLPLAPTLTDLKAALPETDPVELALHGGEDYELLATLPAAMFETAAAKLRERFGTQLTDIGEIRSSDGLLGIEADGTARPIEARGWDHFGS